MGALGRAQIIFPRPRPEAAVGMAELVQRHRVRDQSRQRARQRMRAAEIFLATQPKRRRIATGHDRRPRCQSDMVPKNIGEIRLKNGKCFFKRRKQRFAYVAIPSSDARDELSLSGNNRSALEHKVFSERDFVGARIIGHGRSA